MPDGNNDIIWSELCLLRQDMREMHQELTRYKGFVGGVMASFAFMVTAANLAWAYLRHKL